MAQIMNETISQAQSVDAIGNNVDAGEAELF